MSYRKKKQLRKNDERQLTSNCLFLTFIVTIIKIKTKQTDFEIIIQITDTNNQTHPLGDLYYSTSKWMSPIIKREMKSSK